MPTTRHSIFISYRRTDSVWAVDQLDERLKQAFGAETVFRDASSIAAGDVFPEDIRRALAEARVGLVVIGPSWLNAMGEPKEGQSRRRLDDPTDWVRLEIETLLGREGVAVVPLLLGGTSVPKAEELPPSLRKLPERNGMSLRPYPDTEHTVRLVIEAVAKVLNVTPRTSGLVTSAATEPPPRVAASRLSVTGREFVGRDAELHLLDEAWGRSRQEDKINIISFIGQGGEGKTAVVLEWYARRARHGWQGARRVFDWSFYSQGTNAQSAASADEFFGKAFVWFGHQGEVPRDPWTKGETLAGLIAAESTLLVLDGLEPLQQPPGDYGGEFKDPAMKALLRALAVRNPGLCVLTSRTDITDLKEFEHADGSCLRHPLHALDADAARHLLRELGVRGPDPELDEAIVSFKGHAYDLNLLGNYLAKCTPDHEIRRWKEILLLEEDGHVHGRPEANGHKEGHGRRMLRAHERWLGPDTAAVAILRLLGLFDRPARSDLLDELRAAPVIPGLTEPLVDLPGSEWLRALDQLQGLGLIAREEVAARAGTSAPLKTKPKRPARPVSYALDTHPLLREHFAAELREGGIGWVGSNGSGSTECPAGGTRNGAWRDAHRRLYRYLRDSTPNLRRATIDELQPLCYAVSHACRAGFPQGAFTQYYRKIDRGDKHHLTDALGAVATDFGLLGCLFEGGMGEPLAGLKPWPQAYLLRQLGMCYRCMGKMEKVEGPLRRALDRFEACQDWGRAVNIARHLAQFLLVVKGTREAKELARKAVALSTKDVDPFNRVAARCGLAYILFQENHLNEAAAEFEKAEAEHQRENGPESLLNQLQGYRYCEFLLAKGQREAVKRRTRSTEAPVDSRRFLVGHALTVLVGAQAEFELEEVRKAKGGAGPGSVGAKFDAALTELKRAGQQEFVVVGLVAHAGYRSRVDDLRTAKAELDIAWKIAERGCMRLYQADIHLCRARLFGSEKDYPWTSPQTDLAAARKLIASCGYWRRQGEL